MSELEAKLRAAADAIASRDKPFLPADDMSLLEARKLLLETGCDSQIDLTITCYTGNGRIPRETVAKWQVYLCEKPHSSAFFEAPSLRHAVAQALASIAAERASPPADPLAAAQAALEPATVAAAPGF